MELPVVAFDLVGPMAHFRKFYTNSSSLSYHVPPRTVLMGVVAALLGWPREGPHNAGYYERLHLEQAALGVSLRVPVRTIIQTVNFLATDDGDWHGIKSRTQIPTELVLPKDPDHRAVLRYRIFLMHRDPGITREVAEQARAGRYAYPLFLGTAFCPAWVENARLYEPDQVVWANAAEIVPVDTVVLRERLHGDRLPIAPGLRILPDRMPLDLHPNRTLKAVAAVLWEDNGRPLSLAVQGRRFRLPEDKGEVWHTFLEDADAPF